MLVQLQVNYKQDFIPENDKGIGALEEVVDCVGGISNKNTLQLSSHRWKLKILFTYFVLNYMKCLQAGSPPRWQSFRGVKDTAPDHWQIEGD